MKNFINKVPPIFFHVLYCIRKCGRQWSRLCPRILARPRTGPLWPGKDFTCRTPRHRTDQSAQHSIYEYNNTVLYSVLSHTGHTGRTHHQPRTRHRGRGACTRSCCLLFTSLARLAGSDKSGLIHPFCADIV